MYASGATSISSRCSISLLEKNEDTTFANEFVMTAIMIKPGAMNVVYDTPSMVPMRPPTRLPKMMKYKVIVMAGGTIVWIQIRTTRRDSLRTIVVSPTKLMRHRFGAAAWRARVASFMRSGAPLCPCPGPAE